MTTSHANPAAPSHSNAASAVAGSAALAAAPRLSQLIYLSEATQDFTADDLSDLLNKARSKNRELDVSGMLVYRDGCFPQVIEGDETSIDALFNRISADPRHKNVSVLMRGVLSRRDFGDWRMGFVNADDAVALPGFSDFFGPDFEAGLFGLSASLARKMLLAFRDERWRRTPDAEAERRLIQS